MTTNQTNKQEQNKVFDFIKDNNAEFENGEQLSDFINSYLSDNHKLTELEDYISEFADVLVPIYYNDYDNQLRGDYQKLLDLF